MIDLALGLQLVLFLAVAAAYLGQAAASLFHPLTVYLAFHGLVFVLRPMLVHYAEFHGQWTYMGFTPSPAGFVETLAVASLALVCFAGASLAAGTARPAATPRPFALDRAGRQAVIWVTALLLPLALYAAWRDLGLFGQHVSDPAALTGDSGMLRDPETGKTVFVGTTAYLVKAHNLLAPLSVLLIVVAGFRWWAYAPFAGFVLYRLYLGSRWGVVLGLLMLVLVHLLRTRRRWPGPKMLLPALPVVALFLAVGLDRDLLRSLGAETPRHAAAERPYDAGRHALDTPDFANFDFLAFIVDRVPKQTGTYSYFTQHLQVVTRPVPRVLWPDKPEGSPVKLVRLTDHGRFAGRTRSLPGDGWMSLGWAGVALTMSGAGLALGWLHRRFLLSGGTPFAGLAYAAFLPATIQLFRDGALVSLARFSMWMLLPLLLSWALAALIRWLAGAQAETAP